MSEDLQDFESFPDDVREGIRELGWSQPMPVQSRVIPFMRQGRDLIVQALTGSGKTGAFGLPIVEQLDPQQRGEDQATGDSAGRVVCSRWAIRMEVRPWVS